MARKSKKVNNRDLLKQYIEDAFDYIGKSKNYIYSMVLVFVFFVFVGFFILPLSPLISEAIGKSIRDIVLKTEGLSGIGLILYIFMNNLKVAFYSIFFGIVGGIYPIVSSIANGSVLGYVFAKVYGVAGFSPFWRILPHGIFELPAVFISLGLGVKLGMFIFSNKPGMEFKYRLINSIKVLFFVIIPLLIVAAIIEGLLITLIK